MKTQMSFNIYIDQINDFTKIVPETLRAHTICKFLKKEYIPSKIFNAFEGEGEAYQIRMDKSSINKLDEMVKIANESGLNAKKDVNRSAIMRDVFEQFINKYRHIKFPKPERKRTLLHVEAGTISKLAKYIDSYERNKTIEEFIVQEYSGPIITAKELKKRLRTESELIPITLDATTFLILDEIAEEFGENVKRAHILRDAINQLSQRFNASLNM
ncbi:hypothetical protein CN644_29580 [Bacillus wiedmannii]|uniref:hypothetical protein n=1 Tax=Bacillus wiedmannii TaxID=1890302 RepID=UPI000BF13AF3|nr:hypothetical protein [Bacillus wiedmannii]PEI31327.1 hypothetical protein CN644_29580 [Bacillus wiedmannii]